MSEWKCPNCGGEQHDQLPDFIGLMHVRRVGSGEYKINPEWFIPTKPIVCNRCGFVQLFYSEVPKGETK